MSDIQQGKKWLSWRKVVRRARKRAIRKETLAEVSDQRVAAAFKSTTLEREDARQLILDLRSVEDGKRTIAAILGKYQFVILIVLFSTTLHLPNNEDASLLGPLGIGREVALRFREIVLVFSAILTAFSTYNSNEAEVLEALKNAVIRRIFPSNQWDLMTTRYSSPKSTSLVQFETLIFTSEPGSSVGVSTIGIAAGLGAGLLSLFAALLVLLFVHVWVLLDIVHYPTSPVWISYAAVGFVVAIDLLSLVWLLVLVRFKRRILYTSEFVRQLQFENDEAEEWLKTLRSKLRS